MEKQDIDRLRRPNFTIVRRGYDQREVEKLLERLADWLESDAAEEIGQFAIKRKLELVGKSTAHILLTTEQEAEQMRSRTEEECANLVAEAESAGREVRRVAEEAAQKTRERAEAEAQRIIDAANGKARKTAEEGEKAREKAQAEAHRTIEAANAKARTTVEEGEKARERAEAEARRTTEKANAKARSTVDEANAKAQATVEEADAKARTMVEEAERRRMAIEAAIAELTSRRDNTLRTLERLHEDLSATVTKHKPAMRASKRENSENSDLREPVEASPSVDATI